MGSILVLQFRTMGNHKNVNILPLHHSCLNHQNNVSLKEAMMEPTTQDTTFKQKITIFTTKHTSKMKLKITTDRK